MNTAQNMQAATLYGIRDVRLEQRPVPTPGPGEALLRILSVGVCGSDVHYYLEGRIGHQVVSAPIIMGHEFSAYVTALGPGVEGLDVGDLVAVEPGISCGECEMCQLGHPNLCPHVRFCGTPPVDGVFAEYAVMPARNCFRLPAAITPPEGALLEPLGIAIHAVNLAHLRPGDRVAVLGAGPIGLLCAAVARAAGASAVYASEPLAYRREFARRYAATEVYDPSRQDVVAEVLSATSGRGVDVVFEAAGADETPQQAAGMVRTGGKILLAGIPASDRVTFQASVVRRKGLTIKLVRRMKHTYPHAIRLVHNRQVDVQALITHTFPLAQAGPAMDLVAAYQDGVIKAIIQVGSTADHQGA